MGFKRVGSLSGSQNPFEYFLGTDAEAYTLGEALVQTSGRLTKCGATATPEFICMKDQAAESTAVTPIPVERVKEDVEYSATSTATVPATVIGSKVTLHTDGLSPTATTSSGVFLISATDGATTNSKVRGYFRR
jgi:hypothetical protein